MKLFGFLTQPTIFIHEKKRICSKRSLQCNFIETLSHKIIRVSKGHCVFQCTQSMKKCEISTVSASSNFCNV